MFFSDTSSRDYPELYLESDYGQRTVIKKTKLNNFSYIVGFFNISFFQDRDADFATDQENGHTTAPQRH